jgi:hypothetical protein
MNILYLDTQNGKLVAKNAVTMGGLTSTQSEQSVVVKDYKAVVVNNWFDESEIHPICRAVKAFVNHFGFSDKMAQGCPFLLG